MRLNDAGQIVAQEWIKTAQIRNEIELDEWVVMPNHFHGIVMISDPGTNVGDWRNQMIVPTEIFGNRGLGDQPVAPTGARSRSLGAMVGGFKSAVTTRINKRRQTPGVKYWQRNYWERIIRNESELDMIREYIFNNPVLWESDKLHPDNQ